VHVSTLMYLISCGNVRFEDNKIIKKVKKKRTGLAQEVLTSWGYERT